MKAIDIVTRFHKILSIRYNNDDALIITALLRSLEKQRRRVRKAEIKHELLLTNLDNIAMRLEGRNERNNTAS